MNSFRINCTVRNTVGEKSIVSHGIMFTKLTASCQCLSNKLVATSYMSVVWLFDHIKCHWVSRCWNISRINTDPVAKRQDVHFLFTKKEYALVAKDAEQTIPDCRSPSICSHVQTNLRGQTWASFVRKFLLSTTFTRTSLCNTICTHFIYVQTRNRSADNPIPKEIRRI